MTTEKTQKSLNSIDPTIRANVLEILRAAQIIGNAIRQTKTPVIELVTAIIDQHIPGDTRNEAEAIQFILSATLESIKNPVNVQLLIEALPVSIHNQNGTP